MNKWGIGQYTTLLQFDTGEILWTMKKVFTGVMITDQYIFNLKGSKLEALYLRNGKEHFIVYTTFKWTAPKLALIGENYTFIQRKKDT